MVKNKQLQETAEAASDGELKPLLKIEPIYVECPLRPTIPCSSNTAFMFPVEPQHPRTVRTDVLIKSQPHPAVQAPL